MSNSRFLSALLLAAALAGAGCAYRYYATPLKPLNEEQQGTSHKVADDGTVTFTQGRLEVSLRPMTDEELNRQFSAMSHGGARSTNPYTFGDSKVFRTDETPQRFTVFRLQVENYEFPKVLIDPARIYLTTSNGRKYYALTLAQLRVYFRRYALGGAETNTEYWVPGNENEEQNDRETTLNRTLYPAEQIFSAQEKEGYVVFQPLAADVEELTVHIPDMVVRFDYKGDPSEYIDVTARFGREIGRQYPDGRKVAMDGK
ncbi:MAG: hypothetical protein FJY95_01850 [Candidatus Handelsmanbacteria bacterium]|nr:hypothetical protein [Candidatus Handelsmanbacteria bacterium]